MSTMPIFCVNLFGEVALIYRLFVSLIKLLSWNDAVSIMERWSIYGMSCGVLVMLIRVNECFILVSQEWQSCCKALMVTTI